MRSFTILAVLLAGVFSVQGSCDLPPSVWCSSVEIAKKCNVYSQCRDYLQRHSDAPPVNFTLYYESLCPDCKQFISHQLYDTFQDLGTDVMNLTLVPYGNARESKRSGKWEFECQHGEEECVGNVIETCSIAILKNISVYFPFIHCMEESDSYPERAATKCAEKLQIDLDPITSCANGALGNDLEHIMAVMTNKLDPPHQYVPWVTLNGVHTEKIQHEAENNLKRLICKTYKGPTPKGCNRMIKQDYENKCFNV